MKNSRIIPLLLLFWFSMMISCDIDLFDGEDDDIQLTAKFNDIIGPIEVTEIVYGSWRGTNHIQGICFDENTLYISSTKQLTRYSMIKERIVEEQECHDLADNKCEPFHYGDPAFYEGDLWVPLSTSKTWKKDYYCTQNKLIIFEDGVLEGIVEPTFYLLDFPGHIGAVEILNDKLYVGGKNINDEWPHDDNCHEEQLIYVYNIEDLNVNTCNVHNEIIRFAAHGKNGIQNLAVFDPVNLLVTAYKCEDDPTNYVYLLNLETGNHRLYRQENWGYGVALNSNGILYFCEDNRNTSTIKINGILP